MSHDWDALRKDARRLETDIDTKLVTYSKLSSSLTSSSSRTTSYSPVSDDAEAPMTRRATQPDLAPAESMTCEMETLLSRLQAVVGAMAAGVAAAGKAAPGLAHTLQRHEEILADYTSEFRKIRASVEGARSRAELMAGGGRSARAVGGGGGAAVRERDSIAGAERGAERAIGAGLSLKEDLERQRAMFASMVERMETMSEGMPAVGRLIGSIRRKKKRDFYILGGVIAVLLFITFSWKVL